MKPSSLDRGETMKRFNIATGVLPRIVLASISLASIFAVAGHNISPETPVMVWLLYCLLGAAVIGAALIGLAVVHLAVGQWVLRKGGTDPQWFWFDREPQGLADLRERIRLQRQEQQERHEKQ
jgi:hypothetical protein